MTAIEIHQSGLLLKSLSNYAIILLAQVFCMFSLTISLLKFFILRPSFLARLRVCRKQSTKIRSKKTAAANKIASIM